MKETMTKRILALLIALVLPTAAFAACADDACNAIKISIDRPNISASLDERDVFGTQQQATIECMQIPIYAAALTHVSSF